jgi:chromate transporter
MSTAIPGAAAVSVAVSAADANRVWLKIGLLSFGGPAGQIALMHRLLVEEKRWIDEARFLHALNYCMLLPGPEAQQLATFVGWMLRGTWGGIIAGSLFILPGALVMLALSMAYALFGTVPLVAAAFIGIKAAVLAIVVDAVIRIGRRALGTRAKQALGAIAFVAIFFLGIPFPLIVLWAAIAGALLHRIDPTALAGGGHGAAAADDGPTGARPPQGWGHALRVTAVCLPLWAAPILVAVALLGPDHVFVEEAVFFSKMAVVTFGGAYAVLTYIAQQAVEIYGWLDPGDMLNGLGLAETTPGPLILVAQFVGFLAAFRNPVPLEPLTAGVLGAALTTWVTFVPCFYWIFLGAPYVEALRTNRALSAALSAVTAAVVGVVLNLTVWFALNVSFGTVTEVWHGPVRLWTPDPGTVAVAPLVLAAVALVAVLRFRVQVLAVLGAGAVLGMLTTIL